MRPRGMRPQTRFSLPYLQALLPILLPTSVVTREIRRKRLRTAAFVADDFRKPEGRRQAISKLKMACQRGAALRGVLEAGPPADKVLAERVPADGAAVSSRSC